MQQVPESGFGDSHGGFELMLVLHAFELLLLCADSSDC